MNIARIRYLQGLIERRDMIQRGISMGEIAEIEGAFAELDPDTLMDLPENATIGDMLEELEAAHELTHRAW